MKLRLLCVGRISEAWLRTGIEDYAGRIARYLPFSTLELKEEKGGKKADPRLIRDREGERLLERIPAGAFAVVFDERGKRMGSEAVADLLQEHMVRGTSELTLVIGGAYGLSDPVKARGDLLLSLSPLTFTHQMARLLALEQVYRGLTIVRGEPYHNR